MSRTLGRITTLILDFDGVIRHWDGEALEAAAMAIGMERGVLFEIAFDEALTQQSMTGVITAETWQEEIARRVAGRSGIEAKAVEALWEDPRWARIDEEVLAVVGAVRDRGHRVALFSNATTRLERDLERLGVSDHFDVVVNSARLGLAKPDPEAFAAAAARVGVEPSVCVFVDDRPDNVEGARRAGMRAEVYAGVADLHRLLVEVGLLGRARGDDGAGAS